MEYIKFCQKEFNPLHGCETLQLGTLRYYRELEKNKKISDASEGSVTFLVGNYKSSEDDSGMNLFGHIGPNINITMKNSLVVNNIPNCYIFSLTTNKDIKGNQFDNDYTSSYKIKNLTQFIDRIKLILKNSILLGNFEPHSIYNIYTKNGFRKRVEIITYHQEIVYNDTKRQEINSANEIKYKNIPNAYQVLFTKDIAYSSDKEYRIAFVFKYRNRILSVKKEPIIISNRDVIKLFY